MKKIIFTVLTCIIFVVGCSNNNNNNNTESTEAKENVEVDEVVEVESTHIENSQNTLEQYIQAMSTHDAVKIVELYGGSYEWLKSFSPDVDQDNKQKLMQSYLLNTDKLSLNEIVEISKVSRDECKFVVTFNREDGALFQTRMLDIITQKFFYTVKRVDGELKVMELPPYQA